MPRFKDDLKGHYNNDDKADRAKSDEYLKTYDAINTNAPEFLDDQAKKIFAEMIHASKENTLKSIDAPLLATFSQIYSNVINAIQNINENGLVIDGKINPYERILNKIGVAYKNFHSLRHTFATRAIEMGMDVKTLSEILGHKNPVVTLTRYTHSMMSYKTDMMNKMGKMLAV